VLPYLVHPWVVANDRLKLAGWQPRHTNEEAIMLASPPPRSNAPFVWGAALGGLATSAGAAAWFYSRRRKRQVVR
jgi:hypothetical protein